MRMIPHNRVYVVTMTVTLVTAQLITFKDGKLGVNFLGFRAGVGLGGLLNGDLSKGGLHVEAGTPFGQEAKAGLGGAIGSNGEAGGGLYAGATAGNGVSAAAGLQGAADGSGSVGQAAAGASAGGIHRSVEKTFIQPIFQPSLPTEPALGTSDSENVIIRKRKTLSKFAQAHYDAANGGSDRPETVQYVEKSIETQPSTVVINKEVSSAPPRGGLLKMLFANLGNGPAPSGQATGEGQVVYSKPAVGYGGTANFTAGGNLFNDIFNIPISTLQAVNRLVNNIVGGGSVSVTKTAKTN